MAVSDPIWDLPIYQQAGFLSGGPVGRAGGSILGGLDHDFTGDGHRSTKYRRVTGAI